MRESRTVTLEAPEVRAADEKELRFTGHAAIFNERTWIGPKRWGFWEQVDPGFFRSVLDDDTAFLVNHDPNIVLARNGNTMTLATDARGLVPDAQWDPQDADARMWAGRVRRGDVTKMSFAFTVAEEKWSEDETTGEETRTLLTAERLYDVSLVTYPAYAGTDGAMRDAAAEVVKRHRGVDPRDEKRERQPADLPPQPGEQVNEPAQTEQTEDPPVDSPAPSKRELLVLRHRLIAARHQLPL